ncbi:uncharacterized protein LOC100678357 isoform X1 [Nasonia vitripennis]|uniref:Uncharacterized protein n=2 Tax=Nasonia vitripennis TaxID=7425 RepID=A0A7M7M1J9_NASVI|nr:uncharacterized protein LOC100678357 isoform X1 [Nasonia vitripennis]
MGRRYIYSKKRRVRKVPNNVVLEFENEKHLTTNYVHETHETKSVQAHSRTVNLDSELTLPPSTPTISSDNRHLVGLHKKSPNGDNRFLVNLEHPMTLNLKKNSIVMEHPDDEAEKRLHKNEFCKVGDTEIKPEVLNKTILNKIKIEPLKKTSSPIVNSKTISQIVTTKHSSNVIKNNRTFILVSKTSLDDIEKNPINLIPNANLKQISFKTLGARLSNSQMKNVIVQHKPVLLPKLASATSLNPIVCVRAPDKGLQASGNVQHKSIPNKLTFASISNPIMCIQKSEPPSNRNILVQKHKIVNNVEKKTLDINVLNAISDEDTKRVYPVALKANNFKDNGVLEIFSNDVDSENEMHILGI